MIEFAKAPELDIARKARISSRTDLFFFYLGNLDSGEQIVLDHIIERFSNSRVLKVTIGGDLYMPVSGHRLMYVGRIVESWRELYDEHEKEREFNLRRIPPTTTDFLPYKFQSVTQRLPMPMAMKLFNKEHCYKRAAQYHLIDMLEKWPFETEVIWEKDQFWVVFKHPNEIGKWHMRILAKFNIEKFMSVLPETRQVYVDVVRQNYEKKLMKHLKEMSK